MDLSLWLNPLLNTLKTCLGSTWICILVSVDFACFGCLLRPLSQESRLGDPLEWNSHPGAKTEIKNCTQAIQLFYTFLLFPPIPTLLILPRPVPHEHLGRSAGEVEPPGAWSGSSNGRGTTRPGMPRTCPGNAQGVMGWVKSGSVEVRMELARSSSS